MAELWLWIGAGLALGVLELLVAGYVLLGLGIGAIIVGLLVWLGVLAVSFGLKLVLVAALALVAWVALRRGLGPQASGHVKLWERDINE